MKQKNNGAAGSGIRLMNEIIISLHKLEFSIEGSSIKKALGMVSYGLGDGNTILNSFSWIKQPLLDVAFV